MSLLAMLAHRALHKTMMLGTGGCSSAIMKRSGLLFDHGNKHTPMQCAGFKDMTVLKLRCQFCYFIRIDGRIHVLCRRHQRHKQRERFNVKLLW